MPSKLALLTTLIILLSGWIAAEGYLTPVLARAGSAKETHGSKEATVHVDEAHGPKESHGAKEDAEGHKGAEVHEAEKHGEEHEGAEAHETEGHGGEESWWRFPGWQIVFAAIACLYFALVLAWLPLLVAKEAEGGHH